MNIGMEKTLQKNSFIKVLKNTCLTYLLTKLVQG